ncbi:MAG: hypothetical protein WKH64_13910 [Chloroflexia bacterium]
MGVELGAVQLVVDSLITTGHCLTHGADRDLDAAERSYSEAVVRLSAGDAQSVLSTEACWVEASWSAPGAHIGLR